ncbi:MAG TPA: hypothetical protein VHI52_17840, partial [Verrucomicrobiae bacterium]|nr:hypothetical protein [Verrucomicrobiae bacterium]
MSAITSARMPRREFVKTGAGFTALATMAPLLAELPAKAADPAKVPKTVGIQIGAVSFVDEGTDKVLDLLQERVGVNTLFLTAFTYGRGLAGRQIPGYPFPDHGVQESDEAFFHGGNYATPHREFYADTILKQTRAPDHGDFDV